MNVSISRHKPGVGLIRLCSISPRDQGAGHFSHFLDMAIGSIFETVACFFIAEKQTYLSKQGLEKIKNEAESLGKKINAFKATLR